MPPSPLNFFLTESQRLNESFVWLFRKNPWEKFEPTFQNVMHLKRETLCSHWHHSIVDEGLSSTSYWNQMPLLSCMCSKNPQIKTDFWVSACQVSSHFFLFVLTICHWICLSFYYAIFFKILTEVSLLICVTFHQHTFVFWNINLQLLNPIWTGHFSTLKRLWPPWPPWPPS